MQSQVNGTNPPPKPAAALSPQGQAQRAVGQVNRRIQNIVSPIKDSTPAPMTRTVPNNLMVVPAVDSPQAAQRHVERRREGGGAAITYQSALDHNGMRQSVCDEAGPRYPPLHSEQQSIIENSLFYDTMRH